MRDMTNKLEADIKVLKGKQSNLKAKLAVAETKKKMNNCNFPFWFFWLPIQQGIDLNQGKQGPPGPQGPKGQSVLFC